MKHYETTDYGMIKVSDYPKGWFGSKQTAEEQGIYTSFKKCKARMILDYKEAIAEQKQWIKECRKLKVGDVR